MTYLFNRTYAEQNGWTKDDAAERQLKALPLVLKVLGFIALEIVLEVCTSYFLDDFYGGWIFSALILNLWLPFTVYLVIKHSRGNDKSLNAEFIAFVENVLY